MRLAQGEAFCALSIIGLFVTQCYSAPLIIRTGLERKKAGQGVDMMAKIEQDLQNRALAQPAIESVEEPKIAPTDDNIYATIPPVNESDTQTKTGTSKIQEAAAKAAGAVLGKVLEQGLAGLQNSKDKAALAVAKALRVNVKLDDGFESMDVLHPGNVHADAEFEREDTEEETPESQSRPLYYVNGVGGMIVNHCFETEYPPEDPCYSGLSTGTTCANMLDGASYIGTGFDGRGEYSSESRRASIVQRDCSAAFEYDTYSVPNGMSVQGIYDTQMFTMVFGSAEEYSNYLMEESGESNSFFRKSKSVTNAYGMAEKHTKNLYLGMVSIDITRYELFLDTVGPSNLNPDFLKDFMSLPIQYYAPGAPDVLQDFVLRWGTHYIKSSPFGGQLEFRKVASKERVQSKEEFAEEIREDVERIFTSYHSVEYSKETIEKGQLKEWESMSLSVAGGEQEIASALSDMYAPGFKTAFVSWLDSIRTYPKPIKFTLGRITELVDFKESDLFPQEDAEAKWGCEAKEADGSLILDEERNMYYYNTTVEISKPGINVTVEWVIKRVYCPYLNRKQLTHEIQLRKKALETAVTVYLEEGPLSTRSVYVPAGALSCDSDEEGGGFVPFDWDRDMTGPDDKTLRVQFDMRNEILGSGGLSIPSKSGRDITFHRSRWYTRAPDGLMHLYNGYNNGGTGNLNNKKLSLLGLVLSYDANEGSLVLSEKGYNDSDQWHSKDLEGRIGDALARAYYYEGDDDTLEEREYPCNVQWSNTRRMSQDQCLHFSASTAEAIFVTLAASPGDITTWYYIKISIYEVAIYKEKTKETSTQQLVALSLGDRTLFRDYVVCTRQEDKEDGYMQILYGVSSTSGGNAVILLPFYDPIEGSISVEYFGFGSGNDDVQVANIELMDYDESKLFCQRDDNGRCISHECPDDCDAVAGCYEDSNGIFHCIELE